MTQDQQERLHKIFEDLKMVHYQQKEATFPEEKVRLQAEQDRLQKEKDALEQELLLEERFLGIDFGEIPLGTCTICDDYIWDNEVDRDEAFFEAFDPRPPHHNRCLSSFMKTGKLLPRHMEYYQNPERYFANEDGVSYESMGHKRGEMYQQAEREGWSHLLTPIKRMSWEDVVAFLTERAVARGFLRTETAAQKLPEEISVSGTIADILSGKVSVPVFACRYHYRPDFFFVDRMTAFEADIGSVYEKNVIRGAEEKNQVPMYIVVAPSKHLIVEEREIARDDLCDTGVLAELSWEHRETGELRATLKTLERVRIAWEGDDNSLMARLAHLPDVKDLNFGVEETKDKIEIILTTVQTLQAAVFPPEVALAWAGHRAFIQKGEFGSLLDLIAFYAGRGSAWEEDVFPYRYAVLEAASLSERLDKTAELASYFYNRMIKIRNVFANSTKQQVDAHHEAEIRGKIAALQKELGGDDIVAEYTEKVQKVRMTPETEKAAKKELGRLARAKEDSQERSVILRYLDWLIEFPWRVSTTDTVSLLDAERMLDEDHYALYKPKDEIKGIVAAEKRRQYVRTVLAYASERGVEVAAQKFGVSEKEILDWQKQAEDEKAGIAHMPILAFVGPPGVGKTSLGKSIACALGRKFCRMSLGGVNDEAEFRGHRRTYVDALPGVPVQALKRVGSNNPVFVLDEADRLSVDSHHDPSGALVEMLDPEQNFAFKDHYLGNDVPVDLSNVLFICTSNTENFHPALRDRLKVIQVDGYTEEEKIEIAKQYLIPQTRRQYWLNQETPDFADTTLQNIIRRYTREDGVRELKRCIDTICVKTVRHTEEEKSLEQHGLYVCMVTPADLPEFLGTEKFVNYSDAVRALDPGITIGMVVTGSVMGSLGFVEAVVVPGNKPFVLSVKAGESMQRSLETVATFLRSERAAQAFGYEISFFKNHHLEYHLDLEDGGDDMDGTSAGAAFVLAGLGIITGMKFRTDTAVTGKLTAFGKLRPIGGVKAKALEARRRHIRHIVLPAANEKDLADIPQPLRDQLEFHCVETVFEAAEFCFEKNETIEK